MLVCSCTTMTLKKNVPANTYTYACRKCHAKRGMPCMRPRGVPAMNPHKERIDAASVMPRLLGNRDAIETPDVGNDYMDVGTTGAEALVCEGVLHFFMLSAEKLLEAFDPFSSYGPARTMLWQEYELSYMGVALESVARELRWRGFGPDVGA